VPAGVVPGSLVFEVWVLKFDRVEPVDGQLAQGLKVGALTAEALEQERRVGDGQLMPAVDRRPLGVGSVVVLRELAGHLDS